MHWKGCLLSVVLLWVSEFVPFALGILEAPNSLVLNITTNLTHAIPSTLFGYMWEVRASYQQRLLANRNVIIGY
jgi:hypothetical protein